MRQPSVGAKKLLWSLSWSPPKGIRLMGTLMDPVNFLFPQVPRNQPVLWSWNDYSIGGSIIFFIQNAICPQFWSTDRSVLLTDWDPPGLRPLGDIVPSKRFETKSVEVHVDDPRFSSGSWFQVRHSSPPEERRRVRALIAGSRVRGYFLQWNIIFMHPGARGIRVIGEGGTTSARPPVYSRPHVTEVPRPV